jgi:hypothetical protein
MQHRIVLAILIASFAACSTPQTSIKLERFELEGVGDAALPATIFDGMVNAPEGVFHLRIEAVTGWFSTDNRRYEHGVDLRTSINGQVQPLTYWRDH